MTAPVHRPVVLDDVDACVDAIIERVGTDLRVGLPLGLGKPPELVNALFQRAKADPSLRLTLLTALSLEVPVPAPGLETAFLQPLLDRVFAGVVELDYARAVTAGELPPNVRVLEFYFRPGSRLHDPGAQRDYISTNYTFAARDLMEQGCNVAMQAVAKREGREGPGGPGGSDGVRYSLSCNPDTSIELLGLMRAAEAAGERRIAVVGVVNQQLPYMGNDAEVGPESFDLVVDHPRYSTALFSTPKQPVTTPDYAIGLHASALVRDGGTLQIGIGALGDAIVQSLALRHRDNAAYRSVLERTGVLAHHGDLVSRVGGTGPFERGLYGASEMFVDGFWHLMRAGVLTRAVYDFWALQELVTDGTYDPTRAPTLETLEALEARGVRILRTRDFDILKRHGFFADATTYDAGYVVTPGGERVVANLADPHSRQVLAQECLGTSGLVRGIVLHGGFFLGPRDFYQGLRDMTPEERDTICMTGVDKVNQLDADPALYTAQRHDARFVNTGMLATLGGAVASDGLEDGRVVSGVGGQFNFVTMAHQLSTGRSILMVRAARQAADGSATSNIVSAYGHTTIPRHLRDILITEYGIADLRAQTDSEVAKRTLAVADSRFQQQLLDEAMDSGRIERSYEIPEAHRHNTPEELDRRLSPARDLLPPFPFGTDMTPLEQTLATALQEVKSRSARLSRVELVLTAIRSTASRAGRTPSVHSALDAVKALASGAEGAPASQRVLRLLTAGEQVPEHVTPYLERLQLVHPTSVEDAVARALLIDELT
ncbi:hypothetical protein GCM10027596_12040 [Nocardioides korecus]